MANFFIRFENWRTRTPKRHKITSFWGKISIDEFYETLIIPADYWTKEDYIQQWCEGLKRIKVYKKSCLIVSIHNPKKHPLAFVWPLYRDGNTIYIQNHLWIGEDFKNKLAKMPFTASTYYKFVNPRRIKNEDGEKISEWSISLEDVDYALEILKQDIVAKNIQDKR